MALLPVCPIPTKPIKTAIFFGQSIGIKSGIVAKVPPHFAAGISPDPSSTRTRAHSEARGW